MLLGNELKNIADCIPSWERWKGQLSNTLLYVCLFTVEISTSLWDILFIWDYLCG